MRDREYLFSNVGWFSVEEHQKQQMRMEVDSMDGNRLLNTAVGDLARYFEDKFKIEVPALLRDQIVVDQHETQIDVSNDPNGSFTTETGRSTSKAQPWRPRFLLRAKSRSSRYAQRHTR